MLRACTLPLRRNGAAWVTVDHRLLGRGVVSQPYRALRVNAFAIGIKSLSSFCVPHVSCVRHGSAARRSDRWGASKRTVPSWRKAPVLSAGATAKGGKKSESGATSTSHHQRKASGVKNRRRVRGKAQPKRLSAHQRQAKKYNKRVEAIARLWKQQRQQQQQQQQQQQLQIAGNKSKNILASRVK